jgi:hypothetical protein
MKSLAQQTQSSWCKFWKADGITRRTVSNHFGRAYHDAVNGGGAGTVVAGEEPVAAADGNTLQRRLR